MKVVYIVEPRKVIGGGVRAAINLAKSMKSIYGVDTAIFGVYKQSVKDEEVDFRRVKTLKPMSWAYIRSYHRFIKTYAPDVVHCLGLYSALLCLIYRNFTRKKYTVVCTVHRVTMKMRFAPVLKYVLGYISRNLDYTTFLTNYQKKHYFDNVGFHPNKNIVVPNVIHIQPVNKLYKEKKAEFISELNADYLISYVGRIIPLKNIEDTIKITALANAKGLNLGCVLVGGYSQEYYDKLQNLIADLKIDNKVKFVGYVNTPSLFTALSDAIITTTYSEALPNLLIESFSLGKVTFSSDIPQMVELIKNGKNGFTLSLSDLSGWVNVMQNFFNDGKMRTNMEMAALKTYKDFYEPERVAAVYYNIYLETL